MASSLEYKWLVQRALCVVGNCTETKALGIMVDVSLILRKIKLMDLASIPWTAVRPLLV